MTSIMRHMTSLTIREARLAKKPPLRQEDLAKKARVDQAYVSLIEAGKRNPSGDIKRRLAKALGIAPSKLQFSEPQPETTVDLDRDRVGHGHGVAR